MTSMFQDCAVTGGRMQDSTKLVIRALVGFLYPSYQSLQAVMTDDMEVRGKYVVARNS